MSKHADSMRSGSDFPIFAGMKVTDWLEDTL